MAVSSSACAPRCGAAAALMPRGRRSVDDNPRLSGAVRASQRTRGARALCSGRPVAGTIPNEIGGLTSLAFLDLNGDNVTGTIPASLGNLTSLTWLALSSNYLAGTIPESLGRLTALMYLCGGAVPVASERRCR